MTLSNKTRLLSVFVTALLISTTLTVAYEDHVLSHYAPMQPTHLAEATVAGNTIDGVIKYALNVTKSASNSTQQDPSPVLGPNQKKISESEVKASPIQTVEKTVLVPKSYPDGTWAFVNRTIKTTVYPSKLYYNVSTLTSFNWEITKMDQAVKEFVNKLAADLTDEEFKLLNSIIYTQGNNLEMEYNYVQVATKDLAAEMPKIIEVFYTNLDQKAVDEFIREVTQCKTNWIFKPIVTDASEIHRIDAFTVTAEVLVGACTPGAPEVQVLAWSGVKTGAFVGGKYNTQNDDIMDKLLTRWLYRNLHLLFTSKDKKVLKTWMEKTVTPAPPAPKKN